MSAGRRIFFVGANSNSYLFSKFTRTRKLAQGILEFRLQFMKLCTVIVLLALLQMLLTSCFTAWTWLLLEVESSYTKQCVDVLKNNL